MKCIVFAYSQIGVTGLEALLRNGAEVLSVFTHADDPNESLWFPSVAESAARHGLPVHSPKDVNHPLWIERIRTLRPDALFSFYYRNLLGRDLLELPRLGAFNLHGSYLPQYRGRAPVNWVLVNGESETGVTLHHMVAKPDAGDVVGQTRVPISDDDTALTLMGKLDRAADALLDELVPMIREGSARRFPQDASRASTFRRRRPADGWIDWSLPAANIRNLVRAVTRPYPGAFTEAGRRELIVWKAELEPAPPEQPGPIPGQVLSTEPLRVACGAGALRIEYGQSKGGVFTTGTQLCADLNLLPGVVLGTRNRVSRPSKESVLILGVNGFIGRALSERLLEGGRHEVHGMDIRSDDLDGLVAHPDMHFHEGDISIHREWLEYHVRKCDVILPLVAIATPLEYTRNPIRVFELDFEENLRIIRYCVKYDKRVVFPSTSEVYGMCEDEVFDEDRSNLVLGPINKQRWIYSACKQLLDRVIWAYHAERGLRFTLFRPFNWIGPRLDTLDAARIGSSRAITQLILNLVEGTPIQLVDGGSQRRCFTDLRDGIDCLYRIIMNEGGRCDGRIFNIGNPTNDLSIRELAELLVRIFEQHPLRSEFPPFAGFRDLESASYYGAGYQDVRFRRPSVKNAERHLDWRAEIGVEEAVEQTIDYFLRDNLERRDGQHVLEPAPPKSLAERPKTEIDRRTGDSESRQLRVNQVRTRSVGWIRHDSEKTNGDTDG